MRGGKRPNAGRKKGSVSKVTIYRQAISARAIAEGVTPLEVMLTAMRKAWSAGNVEDAVGHAVHAAPYVHPRLAATELKVDDKRSPREFSTNELEELLATELARRATGTEESDGEADSLH